MAVKKRTRPRLKSKPEEDGGGLYFASPKRHRNFISSGSTLLDLALGGGWAEGRISNIIGDKASGKTLLAIGACAEFSRNKDHEKDIIRYAESEAAFDRDYAAALGMPVDRVDFGNRIFTVEDFFEDMSDTIVRCKDEKRRALYILDSMDALSDRAELERSIDEGTYGANKAKQLSEAFRRLVGDMSDVNITLMIISQIRDKINASFGRKWTRAGGRALDFYSSQNLVIADLGGLTKTVKGMPITIGRRIRAKVEKNKVGINHREADFNIIYGFGVDDTQDCLDFLDKVGGLEELGIAKADVKHGASGLSKFVKGLDRMSDDDYKANLGLIHTAVSKHWWELEAAVLPKRRKYG